MYCPKGTSGHFDCSKKNTFTPSSVYGRVNQFLLLVSYLCRHLVKNYRTVTLCHSVFLEVLPLINTMFSFSLAIYIRCNIAIQNANGVLYAKYASFQKLAQSKTFQVKKVLLFLDVKFKARKYRHLLLQERSRTLRQKSRIIKETGTLPNFVNLSNIKYLDYGYSHTKVITENLLDEVVIEGARYTVESCRGAFSKDAQQKYWIEKCISLVICRVSCELRITQYSCTLDFWRRYELVDISNKSLLSFLGHQLTQHKRKTSNRV